LKRTVIIKYEHFTGHKGLIPKGFWTAFFEDDGEGYDYNPKSKLIKSCEEDGYNYKVIRQHQDGSTSIVETNISTQKQ